VLEKKSIESVLLPHVEAGELAGAAALIWRDGGVQDTAAVGCRNLQTGLPVERDTLFRVASLTKPVTALAALTLYDEGRFNLDDSIATCAPELARMRVLRNADGPLDVTDPAARAITFRDLLTHRAGLSYAEFHRGPIGHALATTLGKQIDNPLTPDEWMDRLATLPLIDQPGAAFHYGCSSDLLGFLISRLEGAPLGEVLRQRVFAPLGMQDTGFNVPREKRARRAELCGFDDAGKPTTLSAAPGGHALRERPDDMTFESGSGGLWSTLDDYLAFARALIDDRPGAPRLLRPETRALMLANQLTPEQRASARLFGRAIFARGHGYGMGVAVVMEPEHADPLICRGAVGTVGWPGAYGSWWQADPKKQQVQVFLAHNMLELQQMARGIGLGLWSAIAEFHALANGEDARTL
jgi:CubicO group peptidase (beta-lactamase class C family)